MGEHLGAEKEGCTHMPIVTEGNHDVLHKMEIGVIISIEIIFSFHKYIINSYVPLHIYPG